MSAVVILAGGESRRMKRDKLALPFGAQSLLASAVGRFSQQFEDVYISVADGEKYPEVQAKRIVDIYKGCGPLGGLHAALENLDVDGVFLVAADLPYADPLAAKRMIALAEDADICVMMDGESRYEPLFGYYRKSVLPFVHRALEAGDYKIAALFDKVKVRVVTREALGALWNERLLRNVNYPADYEKLRAET